MCASTTSVIGFLIAIVAILALVVMVIRWAMGRQDKLFWRLLAVLLFMVGVGIYYAGV
jgi:hypothetical protein